MLKYYNFDIVFQEIPDEVTLAINISQCVHHCKGCHSPYLQTDVGNELDAQVIDALTARYNGAITCVCFMGGDHDPAQIDALAQEVHRLNPKLKTGWYSGDSEISPKVDIGHFQFIKIGPYMEEYGSLKSKTTNQRLYRISPDRTLEDITSGFWK